MAEKQRVPFSSLLDQRLEAAFERNLSHADRAERPDQVDADVWERYDRGRPWVLLNVGIMGLRLRRRETPRVLSEASRLFFDRRSNYWVVAELLANHGSLHHETAFGQPLIDAITQTVRSAIEAKSRTRPGAVDDPYPGLSIEAVSLIFCAVAKNSHAYRPGTYFEYEDHEVVDGILRGIRSADRDVDRRLASLRAIAGRNFGSKLNLASLGSLIWGAVGASTVSHDERDKGFALMGVEPILDPVTLATAMLVLEEGRLRDEALASGGELTRRAFQRPRGWDKNVDLEAGTQAYLEYLSVLERERRH